MKLNEKLADRLDKITIQLDKIESELEDINNTDEKMIVAENEIFSINEIFKKMIYDYEMELRK